MDPMRSIHSKEQSCLNKKQHVNIPQCYQAHSWPNIKWWFSISVDSIRISWDPIWTSNFSDKEWSRLPICFALTPEIENFQNLFQSWCIKTLAKKSQDLLGSQQTETQIKEKFQSCVKTSEKGWTSFGCEMNIAGKNAVQCWTPERVKCSLPNSWRDCKLKPQLHVKSIYLMNKEYGPVIEVRHCLIEEIEPQCPFWNWYHKVP